MNRKARLNNIIRASYLYNNLPLSYNYTTLCLFFYLLLLEDKRKVNYDLIDSYCILENEEFLKTPISKSYFKTEKEYEQFLRLKNKEEQLEINRKTELIRFLDIYGELFEVDENSISLKETVSLEILEKLIDKEASKRKLRFYPNIKKETLDFLGIEKPYKELYNLQKNVEEKLEQLYIKLVQDEDNEEIKKQIRELLLQRQDFHIKINEKGKYECLKYYICSYIDEDYTEFPVYMASKEQDELSKANIEEILSMPLQYAIYDNKSLVNTKINDDIVAISNNIVFKSEEKVQTFDEIPYPIYVPRPNFILYFYLKYIKKIDEYIKKYDNKELLYTKSRLLYMLDSYPLQLIDSKRLDLYIDILENKNDLNNINIQEDYQIYKTLIYYFIKEVFTAEKDSNRKLKKLLFISTYYDITEDEKVLDSLSEYKEYPEYQEYKKIIIGNHPTLSFKNKENILLFE